MDYIKLYESGLSIPQVSDETGIPRSTLRFRLKKLGVIRSRADAVRLSSDQGRLGSGMRGKSRVFSDEHKENISKGKKGKGVSLKPNGYIVITMGENKGRSEHTVIMEKKIGRRLFSNECVHHINRIRNDNREENLMLMTKKEHYSLLSKENSTKRSRDKKGRFL